MQKNDADDIERLYRASQMLYAHKEIRDKTNTYLEKKGLNVDDLTKKYLSFSPLYLKLKNLRQLMAEEKDEKIKSRYSNEMNKYFIKLSSIEMSIVELFISLVLHCDIQNTPIRSAYIKDSRDNRFPFPHQQNIGGGDESVF